MTYKRPVIYWLVRFHSKKRSLQYICFVLHWTYTKYYLHAQHHMGSLRLLANQIHMFLTKLIEKTYRWLLKPILFKLDPEYAHDLFSRIGIFLGRFTSTRRVTKKIFCYTNPILSQEFFWLSFENPLGLSAWFDKDVNLPNIMESVGFWFVQVGSITYEAYEWNLKPRLWRLIKDKGLIVNYGLKNKWVQHAIHQLKSEKNRVPISISVAKTNCTRTSTPEAWIQDYISSLQELEYAKCGDIYTINISCPNTFGGEPFTTPDLLEQLLQEIDKLHIHKPTFIKMPVSISWEQFDALLSVASNHNIQWVIISNLIKERSQLQEQRPDIPGWISGKPTQEEADILISKTYAHYKERFLIIWVWGIFTAEDAYHKIKSWASLVQLITWMIFEWPQCIGQINKELVSLLKKDWYAHISEAIGVYHKTISTTIL